MNIAPINTSQLVNQDVNLSYPDDIKAKIIHLLEVYPVISPSMMQIGIGSSLPAKLWRPILNQMLKDEILKMDVFVHPTATGRQQSYTLLSLKDTLVNFPSK